MGMFDRIVCQYPLPDTPKEVQEAEFQTKSLECLLDDFTITSGGLLIKDVYDLVDDDTPRKPTGNKILDDMPRWKRVNDRKETVPYHGDIFFYTHTMDENNKYVWWEYTARFTNGTVEWIRKEEPRLVGG